MTIILTGATGGIGKEIVRPLSKMDEVIGIYFNTEPAALAGTVNISHEKVNLMSADAIYTFVKKSRNQLNRVTVIHGAVLSIDALAINYKDENWDDIINLNLRANYILTKALLPIMMEEKWGRIINISSIIGVRGAKGTIAYSASKSALTGYSRVLSTEYGRFNITSNILALGYFHGGLTDRLDDKRKKMILDSIPCRKFGDIENVVKAIKFLMESEYTNGATINIDGGL